jgi:hypothetical protein
MIVGMILFGLYMASGGDLMDIYSGSEQMPDWLMASDVILSPQDGNQVTTMLAFDINEVMGIPMEVPSYINMGTMLLTQFLWTAIPLVLAYRFFQKRDI